MQEALSRAREFFEMQHGLPVQDRLGSLLRWRAAENDTIELRAFPVKGGGTRLEIETVRNDDIVLAFIRQLPQPGLLDELRNRLRGRR